MAASNKDPVVITPPTPPQDWDPLDADDADLQKYEYEPRPDKNKEPHAFAQWEEIAKRKPQPPRSDRAIEPPTGGLQESQGWAGATVPRDLKVNSDLFGYIRGTFIVPQIVPQINQGKLVEGDYRLWPWVGLGGLTNQHVAQSGLQLEITVKNGQIVRSDSSASILYRFGDGSRDFRVAGFPDFSFAVGDLLSTTVWTNSSNTEVYAWIYNENQNRWSSASIQNLHLAATSAQWIVGGRIPGGDPPYLLPNFDNVLFLNGYAHRQKDTTELTIADAHARNAPKLPLVAFISGNLVTIRRRTQFDP